MTHINMDMYGGDMYGKKRYSGIEYDTAIPDTSVIASPGGTATTLHHHTKGLYGAGNVSSDIFPGMGEMYISGDYGNMYATGHTASQDQGYYPATTDDRYWLGMSSKHDRIEKFSPMDDTTEYFDEPELEGSGEKSLEPSSSAQTKRNAVIIFFIFLMAFIAFDLWAQAGNSYIRTRFYSGNPMSWTHLMYWALGITVLFGLVIYFLDIPLSTFENV